MTEDETFKRLCRPSFEKMQAMYPSRARPTDSTLDNLLFCKKHGWNWVEFVLEQKRRREQS